MSNSERALACLSKDLSNPLAALAVVQAGCQVCSPTVSAAEHTLPNLQIGVSLRSPSAIVGL